MMRKIRKLIFSNSKMSNKFLFLFLFNLIFLTMILLAKINDSVISNFVRSLSSSCSIENDCFSDLWKDIFNVSKYQKLIRQDVLIKTAKFMIQERVENDEELISFVKSLINKPERKKFSSSKFKEKFDFSEYNQSKIIDEILKSKKNGFFVEAGAYDGEKMSNSLFFELERNWTGLLIEPIPQHYRDLISKKRNSFSINACLAKSFPIVAKFKEMDTLSARTLYMSKGLSASIGNHYLYVPCFSLYTIMKAINKTVIDYFSLDLEGAEYEFIQSIDFSKLDIRTLSIELGENRGNIELYTSYLAKFGFKLVSIGYVDLFFSKKN